MHTELCERRTVEGVKSRGETPEELPCALRWAPTELPRVRRHRQSRSQSSLKPCHVRRNPRSDISVSCNWSGLTRLPLARFPPGFAGEWNITQLSEKYRENFSLVLRAIPTRRRVVHMYANIDRTIPGSSPRSDQMSDDRFTWLATTPSYAHEPCGPRCELGCYGCTPRGCVGSFRING